MGNKDQERLMLEHILLQAHTLNNSYLFVISCINYSYLDHTKLYRGNANMGSKLSALLKQIKVAVEGPLWNYILQIASRRLN